MKKGLMITLSIFLALAITGCSKKKAVHEEAADAINLDTLETANVAPSNATATAAGGVTLDSTAPQGTNVSTPAAATTEAAGAPSNEQIQTALKNAGLYHGLVDGKIGPKTKAAIKDFQSANGITPDGRVGPKTWDKLSTYLNTTPTDATTEAAPTIQSAVKSTKRTAKTHSKRSVSEPPAVKE